MGNLYSKADRREFSQWAVGGFLVLLVFAGWALWASYLQFALGYATRPARLMDAQRVEAMSAKMNNAYQALQAGDLEVEGLAYRLREMDTSYGPDRSVWPQGKRAERDQLQQQYLNAVTAYNRACASYMAVYADEYRNLPAPNDLPTQCTMKVP